MAEVWLRSFAGALPTVTRAHPDDDVRRWARDVLVAGGRTWVAVDGGRVVGLLVLRPGWVEQLYVDPAAQGRGIGAALLDLAKARNPGGLRLWTFRSTRAHGGSTRVRASSRSSTPTERRTRSASRTSG